MEPVTIIIISCVSAAVVAAAVITTIVIIKKKKRSRCKKLAALLSGHAEEFEGLYESLYVSCKSRDFDPDTYNEWCDRAALCSDKNFSRAFSASFPKLNDKKMCKKNSSKLLACIKYTGVKRQGKTGGTITINSSNKELFECINSNNAVGKSCSIVKPAWVLNGKAVEPGIVKA